MTHQPNTPKPDAPEPQRAALPHLILCVLQIFFAAWAVIIVLASIIRSFQ
jgi:hypothetical protein